MNHSEVRALLDDYLEDGLELSERSRLEDHVSGCARCSRELAELRATVALLRGLRDVDAPAGLADAVMARVAAGEASAPVVLRAFRRLSEPRLAAPLAAGLTGLAVFVGLQAISPQRGTLSLGPLPTVRSYSPADEVTVLPRVAPRSQRSAAFVRGDAATPSAAEMQAWLDHDLERFFRDPDPLLDHFASLAGSQRESQISAFAKRLSPRDAERVRERLEASGHHLAPNVLVYVTRAPRPGTPGQPLPVLMTSDAPAR